MLELMKHLIKLYTIYNILHTVYKVSAPVPCFYCIQYTIYRNKYTVFNSKIIDFCVQICYYTIIARLLFLQANLYSLAAYIENTISTNFYQYRRFAIAASATTKWMLRISSNWQVINTSIYRKCKSKMGKLPV